MVDKYEKICNKMGAPWSEEMEKILKALFTPEEADILLVFNAPYMDQFTAKKIARKVKHPVEEIEPILEEMARTQRIFSAVKNNTRTYSLFPLLPGLFELFFSNYKRAKAEEKENLMLFAEEYEKYYNKGYLKDSMFSSSYPFMRVLLDQKAIEDSVERGKGTLVQVNQEVEQVKNNILPFEVAKNFVEKSRRVSVMDCACRTHMKIQNNGKPVNDYPINVCMAFNIWADYCIEQEFGRELTKEEALKTLNAAAKAGLVHTTQNITEKSMFMCNCDRDCCVMLKGIHKFNHPNFVASSNFIPEYDRDNCVFCKKCAELCPMYAIELADEESEDKKIEIDLNRCIGCGVCAFNCPKEAITMVKKFAKIPAKDFMEATTKYLDGKVN
ncbi:MAG: 4Fe-4S binding protein [Candidatus Hermodarchaeota archaeon]